MAQTDEEVRAALSNPSATQGEIDAYREGYAAATTSDEAEASTDPIPEEPETPAEPEPTPSEPAPEVPAEAAPSPPPPTEDEVAAAREILGRAGAA
jgi:hypothetical protein